MWAPQGQPHPYGLVFCRPLGLSPEMASFIYYGFPQQIFHVPGISNILYSPLQLQLHLIFSHLTLWRVVWRDSHPDTLLTLTVHPLKDGWVSPWPCNTCILNTWYIKITWTIPRSAASLSSIMIPLETGCSGFWVPRQLNLGRYFPRRPWCTWLPISSPYSRSLSNDFKIVHPVSCNNCGPANSWEVLKLSFLMAQFKVLSSRPSSSSSPISFLSSIVFF
jgi:hypothetical protein